MSSLKPFGAVHWTGQYNHQPALITSFYNGAVLYCYGKQSFGSGRGWYKEREFYPSHCKTSPLRQALEYVGEEDDSI